MDSSIGDIASALVSRPYTKKKKNMSKPTEQKIQGIVFSKKKTPPTDLPHVPVFRVSPSHRHKLLAGLNPAQCMGIFTYTFYPRFKPSMSLYAPCMEYLPSSFIWLKFMVFM